MYSCLPDNRGQIKEGGGAEGGRPRIGRQGRWFCPLFFYSLPVATSNPALTILIGKARKKVSRSGTDNVYLSTGFFLGDNEK